MVKARAIRVLIIDDSALVRKALREVLGAEADIQVVGTAPDAFIARDKIKRYDVDVITLDIEMPRMDGLTFLDKLLRYRPIPAVMISKLTGRGAESTLRALRLGAVDCVAKPSGGQGFEAIGQEIVEKVRAAARANVSCRSSSIGRRSASLGLRKDSPAEWLRDEPSLPSHKVLIDEIMALQPPLRDGPEPLLCVGASTGGTVAIERLLSQLPADCPGVAIVQHLPESFTQTFAARLQAHSKLRVRPAESGMALGRGQAVVASGEHMVLGLWERGYVVESLQCPPVNLHKPSVDVLFRSAANVAGAAAIGVLLTGMGEDGARGLKDLREVGAFTVAQDESSSVVYGMPRVAMELGAASEIAALEDIPAVLQEQLETRPGYAQRRTRS